jgi:S-DNA-T family DNA segregation ATPase FtsK/SpoIIIE
MTFALDSEKESEAVLGIGGGEKLHGNGSVLYRAPSDVRGEIIQTGRISARTVLDNVLAVKKQFGAVDEHGIDLKTIEDFQLDLLPGEEEDELYEEAKRAVIESGKASTSFLQRRFRIGYSRAARLIDLLEDRGVIGPSDGSSSRDILEF